MTPALIALLGYSIGTLQVLLIDWWRSRVEHARQLRLIRAELRRAKTHRVKFDWIKGAPPESNHVPNPPRVSPVFESTVSMVNFRVTDELEDDNAQESLFNLMTGLEQLSRYHGDAMRSLDEATEVSGEQAITKLNYGVDYAKKYDDVLDVVLFQIDDAVRELDRRLGESTIAAQVARRVKNPSGRLPCGPPPDPVGVGDPRVEAWKKGR